jgi:ribosomal protein S18 acetylase RimI-like enzyme
MRVTVIPLDSVDRADAVRAWARSRFDEALLVLADLTSQLRPLARHWIAYGAGSHLLKGVAVCFEGFGQPVASIAAEDEDAFAALFRQVQGSVPTLLFVNRQQPMPANIGLNMESTDAWLISPCVPHRAQLDSEVELLEDANEVQDFMERMGMHFWNPAMQWFGHAFGIRSAQRDLVCAGCLNFLLSEEKYAQIGPVATDLTQRRRSMGTRVLEAIRASLAAAGVRECGVFASESDAQLIDFYRRRGFARRGQFLLFTVMPTTLTSTSRGA